MQFSIREVEEADLSTITTLDQLSVEERSVGQVTVPHPGITLLDLIRSNGHPNAQCFVFVDQDSGEIVGFAFLDVETVTWNGRETTGGYLFHLRVHPNHRRKGVARALAAHREAIAAERGAQVTWAAVVQGNRPSRAYSQSGGYIFGSRIEYRAIPLFLPRIRPSDPGRKMVVRPPIAEDIGDTDRLREDYWRRHQLWAPRRYSLSTQTYAAFDSGGRVVAVADCFEEYRIARVKNLGMKSLPRVANRLLTPVADRFASRYVFVRDLAFADADAAIDLLASLALRYHGEADFFVVGADMRSEAQEIVRRLRGISGSVDILIKSRQAPDPSRPYHMVLG